MENAVVQMEENVVSVREIGTITTEIKDICRQANVMALYYAVQVGRRLHEAKKVLPHGQWGEWLKNEVEFSQSSANNFMRLYDEYGDVQAPMLGVISNSQTFGNLPYTKALQLLAVPREEREAFVAEVNAEDLSVRELQAAIAERDAARKEAAEAAARQAELESLLTEAKEAARTATEKGREASDLQARIAAMQQELDAANDRKQMLEEKLKKAEKDPKIPRPVLDKLRKEAKIAAEKACSDDTQRELDYLRKKVKEADQAAAEAKERLDAAERQLKTANPDVKAFEVIFVSLQESANKLKKLIEKIGADDANMASKLTAALKAFGASL